MISTLLPHPVSAAKWAGVLVLLGAAYVVGLMSGAGSEGQDGVSLTHQSGLIEDAGDLESTPVTALRYGDTPDTTRTDGIEVPTWMDTLSTRGGANTDPDSLRGAETTPSGSQNATSDLPQTPQLNLDGLPYVITPMTNGRPALSVTSRMATLQGFDPRDGTPLEFDVPVPRDTWRLDLQAQGTALRNAAVASTTLQVRRRTALGWIGVGPSYGAVVTNEVTTGAGVTVSFSTTLYSR